jgi:three-Cys-motif partner protein
VTQRFGGRWTDEKLEQLRKYLAAYMRIMTANPRAAYIQKVYFDAFAGSGERVDTGTNHGDTIPQSVETDAEAADLRKGSVQVALETEPAFDQYVFVEKNAAYAAKLGSLREQYPNLSTRIIIERGDANDVLVRWCRTTDWQKTRAVVFLDPYGMQVDWATIEAIAATKAIDLWILFPLGQGVNRLLTRDTPPPASWAARLTRFFGNDDWRNKFYRPRAQSSFLDLPGAVEKNTDLDAIGDYFLERLKAIFAGVAEPALPLRNSKGAPIFLLYFAAGNEKGAPTAVKIARDDIMKAWGGRK